MHGQPPLDLDLPRGPVALLRTTLATFGRHSGLFLSVTLMVVAPVTILVTGVWESGLVSGAHRTPATAAAAFAQGAIGFAMPVLVTALHVVLVRELGDGRVPSVGEVLRAAAPRFPAAVGAVLVYTVLGLVGLILLVVPGVWLLVAGYFGAQIAVLERARPFQAVMGSVRFVRGRWWRTAGALLLGWLVWTVAFVPIGLAIRTLDGGLAYVVLFTLARALELSLSALFGTLLYFSLRAAAREPEPLVAA